MPKRDRDQSLGSTDLLFGNIAKHGLKFNNEVQRGQRASAELMFRVNFVKDDGSEAGANSRVEIGFDTLLLFAFLVNHGIGPDASRLCIGWVGNRHSYGWVYPNSSIGVYVLRS